MISLLHNRRKYLQETTPIPTGGVWADFDLSKLGEPEHCVQLYDPVATYSKTSPLGCYNILSLYNDSFALLVNAQIQGHSYIFNFDSSANAFQLNHLNTEYDKRTPGFSTFYGVFPFADGSGLYYFYNGSVLRYLQIYPSYNIGTSGTPATLLSGATQGIVASPQCCFVSSDGQLLFYKAWDQNILYTLRLLSSWPDSVSAPYFDSLRRFDLSVFNSSTGLNNPAWRSFTFSPDGTIAVFTTNTAVIKVALSVPWDFSTAAYHSHKVISGLKVDGSTPAIVLGGVAINHDGTRLVLHNRVNVSSNNASAAFYDFALSE